MSKNKGNRVRLADRIRDHAKRHPNDKGPQEIVARMDAFLAQILKE